jgi:hypothetical protein
LKSAIPAALAFKKTLPPFSAPFLVSRFLFSRVRPAKPLWLLSDVLHSAPSNFDRDTLP